MGIINQDLTPNDGNGYKKVYLRPDDFDTMIEGQGIRVRVYKTLLCPNYKKIDDGVHELDCKICYGKNFIDRDPLETWAYISNQSDLKKVEVSGLYDDETVSATFKRDVELFYFARVELLDYTTINNELIQRQDGEIDRLRYSAFKVNYLIDKNGIEYVSGQNFILDPNGDIKWTGTRPIRGMVYSVYYDYAVTFRAVTAKKINRFGQDKYNKPVSQAVEYMQAWNLKRDILVQRKDIDGSPLFTNRIIEV